MAAPLQPLHHRTPANRRKSNAVDNNPVATMHKRDVAPTFHARGHEFDRRRVVLAQKFHGPVRKDDSEAPSRASWVLLEQLDLVGRMPPLPYRAEIQPARTTTNHGNAHWPLSHDGPSGTARLRDSLGARAKAQASPARPDRKRKRGCIRLQWPRARQGASSAQRKCPLAPSHL